MITRQQIVDGHRRDATVGAVDHDLCASRLRLDTELPVSGVLANSVH